MTPINDNPTRAMRVVRCDETMAAVLRGERFWYSTARWEPCCSRRGLRRASFRSFYAFTNPEEITGIHIQYVEAGKS